MRIIIACTLTLLLLLTSVAAMAESVNGRLGLTGKVGFNVPLKDLDVGGVEGVGEHEVGVAVGGGLIYGLGDNFAVEVDITHTPSTDVKFSGVKVGEQQLTFYSLGLQYRIMPSNRLVPYIGAGGDAIKGDIENATMDWTYGGHVNAGVDYFINKSIVLTADFKYVAGAKGDILLNGVTKGKYDPMSFVGMFGVRLFLPEKLYN